MPSLNDALDAQIADIVSDPDSQSRAAFLPLVPTGLSFAQAPINFKYGVTFDTTPEGPGVMRWLVNSRPTNAESVGDPGNTFTITPHEEDVVAEVVAVGAFGQSEPATLPVSWEPPEFTGTIELSTDGSAFTLSTPGNTFTAAAVAYVNMYGQSVGWPANSGGTPVSTLAGLGCYPNFAGLDQSEPLWVGIKNTGEVNDDPYLTVFDSWTEFSWDDVTVINLQ